MNAAELLARFKQNDTVSGGSNTAPETRLLLFALAVSMHAQDILETGYDAGWTTEALAWSGARVVGIDNFSEYPDAKPLAAQRLAQYPNVTLVDRNALDYLRETPDNSFDLIFIDDAHYPDHVSAECEQIKRVLRPGGFAVFHDTKYFKALQEAALKALPGWEYVLMPSYSAYELYAGQDFGITVVRKP